MRITLSGHVPKINAQLRQVQQPSILRGNSIQSYYFTPAINLKIHLAANIIQQIIIIK